jgi:hypothetical protein
MKPDQRGRKVRVVVAVTLATVAVLALGVFSPMGGGMDLAAGVGVAVGAGSLAGVSQSWRAAIALPVFGNVGRSLRQVHCPADRRIPCGGGRHRILRGRYLSRAIERQ